MATVRPLSFQVSRTAAPPTWLGAAQAASGVQPAFEPPQPEPPPPDPAIAQQALFEQRVAEATARGEAEGRERAEAEARARAEADQLRLRELLRDLEDGRERLRAAIEAQVIELALCIAEAVVTRELREDPGYAARLAREGLRLLGDADEVEVVVPPASFELVARELGDDDGRRLRVRADAQIAAGCVLETRLARVDATVAGRLRAIGEALEGEVRS